jgi:hypothetical protein
VKILPTFSEPRALINTVDSTVNHTNGFNDHIGLPWQTVSQIRHKEQEGTKLVRKMFYQQQNSSLPKAKRENFNCRGTPIYISDQGLRNIPTCSNILNCVSDRQNYRTHAVS